MQVGMRPCTPGRRRERARRRSQMCGCNNGSSRGAARLCKRSFGRRRPRRPVSSRGTCSAITVSDEMPGDVAELRREILVDEQDMHCPWFIVALSEEQPAWENASVGTSGGYQTNVDRPQATYKESCRRDEDILRQFGLRYHRQWTTDNRTKCASSWQSPIITGHPASRRPRACGTAR